MARICINHIQIYYRVSLPKNDSFKKFFWNLVCIFEPSTLVIAWKKNFFPSLPPSLTVGTCYLQQEKYLPCCNFPMTLSVCHSEGWLVGLFRKGQEVTLPCSYRSACLFLWGCKIQTSWEKLIFLISGFTMDIRLLSAGYMSIVSLVQVDLDRSWWGWRIPIVLRIISHKIFVKHAL